MGNPMQLCGMTFIFGISLVTGFAQTMPSSAEKMIECLLSRKYTIGRVLAGQPPAIYSIFAHRFRQQLFA